MTYAKGGILPGKVDFTADPGERIIPLKDFQESPWGGVSLWRKIQKERMMERTRFIIGSTGSWLGTNYFWKLETKYEPKIGDFAIVENNDTFTMVEIIAIGDTTKGKENLLTGGNGSIYKSVKYIVPREMLEGEKE